MPGLNREEDEQRVVKRLAVLAEEMTEYNKLIKNGSNEAVDFGRFYNRARGRHFKLRLTIFDDSRRYRQQIE